MSGEQHEKQTLFFLGVSGLIASPLVGLEEALIYFASGFVSTFYFSPDLDLPRSRASRRWGLLNPLLWGPYRLFHTHRGASHSYLYGPFSRLAWPILLPGLLLLVMLAVLGFTNTPDVLKQLSASFENVPPSWRLTLVLGYLAGQWAHLLQDGIPPGRLF